MQTIESVTELETHYGAIPQGAVDKVFDHITPLYRRWIETSRFVLLSTVGPEGTDASPRGDSDEAVRLVDPKTVWLPDWRGNNRLDSLKNIVRDGRVSLLFMVPGSDNVVRINGSAVLTADGEITGQFQRQGKLPQTVVVITVGEIYFQCAKALMRSRLWTSRDESAALPTAGEFLKEGMPGLDARAYDDSYETRAKEQLW